MPRIDPLQLLTCLKVLLDKNGGILSLNEVKRIAGLMTKYSKKLVSKCIYIQILKCTKTDLLGEFMGAGGWQLVNLWLGDGLRGSNYPLVTEILELFLLCPVDVERLKSNTSPKLVKQLSREGPPDVRILATRLVEQWLNIVKASNGNSNTNSPTKKTIEKSNQDSKHLKDSDIKKEIENNKSDKIENIIEDNKSPTNKTNDSTNKSSPKRKISTESSSSLTLKIVVKDGKQVVSKIDDIKENVGADGKVPLQDVDLKDRDQDQQSESDEASDKTANKENQGKLKDDETNDGKAYKEGKEKDKTKEKDKNKEKSKDKLKTISSKEKDRHKSSSSSKSTSKSHSSSSKSSSNSSSSSKSKHSNSKSSSRDKERDIDKEREKDKDSDGSSKHKSSSKSTKEKHKHDKEKSSKEKDKEREKEKTNQAEKDKETLSKITPATLEKLGKIPKKPKETNDEVGKQTSITILSKKASMSIEFRKDTEKAKTVKTYKSQFRSHGLTEEAPPPPSRKQLKKPVNTAPISVPAGGILGSSSFASSLKRSSSPLVNNNNSSSTTVNSTNSNSNSSSNSVTPPSEKKPKIDMTTISSNVVEKPGSIKLIAPKPKPSLIESDMFMDALSASAYKKHTVSKRKRRSSITTNAESPTTQKAEPLKFYQDTLEAKDEDKLNKADAKFDKCESDSEKDNTSVKTEDADDDDDIPLKKVKEDIEQKTKREEMKNEEEKGNILELSDDQKTQEEACIAIKKPPGPGCGPDGPPGVLMLHRRSGSKKKLKWRPQQELEEIRYFELDENERVNVTKAFTDMKNIERMHERESFMLARKLGNTDIMVEQIPWRELILVDDVPTHPEGCKSKEKLIQADRERNTLKALYFSHSLIPDSPSEPDMEQYLIAEPKIIPLDDITGNNTSDTVNDFGGFEYPEPKGTPPPDYQEPPDGGLGFNLSEIEFNNQNNQFNNPFLPFGRPLVPNNINNQNNWVAGLGPNGNNNMSGASLSQNNMNLSTLNNLPNMNNLNNINNLNSITNLNNIPNINLNNISNMLRPNLPGPINTPMNGPPPLMATAPLGPINNTAFNIPHMMPFGPNGPPPNGILNTPPQSLLGSIFGPNGIQQQRMNLNGIMSNPLLHNQIGVGNRNNQNLGGNGSGGGNWRSSGPANNHNNGGGNWRSNNNNDRNNNRGSDRSNWVHGNAHRSVCKQFLRGFCRNGSNCNYLHPGNSQRI